VWDFHDLRRERVARAEPNEGHRIIARVQERQRDTWIVTQNIDGLHQRAGSADVLELHGSLWRVRCAACGTIRDDRDCPILSRRCRCGTYLRPDIVWFEDALDMDVVRAAVQAISECDLLVGVGTSGVVYPAAELPRYAAARGAACVEVNPEETPVSGWYRYHLRGPASEMLRRLDA
jgi:NAD-dependent deacetylase